MDNSKSQDNLKVSIKNLNGRIVDSFQVDKSNKKKYKKKFLANEGQWIVDFIGKKDKVNYDYSLDWYGDNK